MECRMGDLGTCSLCLHFHQVMVESDTASGWRRRVKAQFGTGSTSDKENIYASTTALTAIEKKWRHRQVFLESKGYRLRPRLRPGWIPSWTAVGGQPHDFEDSIQLPVRNKHSPHLHLTLH